MNLIAKLQLPDGRVFEVSDEFEATYADAVRLTRDDWVNGDQSCDCNKSALLNEQFNLDLLEGCGETIKLLSLVIDGREIDL